MHMRSARSKNTFGLFLSLAVFASFVCAQASPDEAVGTRIDEYMNALVSVNGTGGTVLAARDGKLIYQKGYGLADREQKRPNDPALRYRIGSLTKQLTAAAVLLLQDKGKLSVTDTACKYIDNCPETWKAITIHQLLTHTGGVPNFTALPEWRTKKSEDLSTRQVVDLVRDLPLKFSPGSDFEYSNTGYVLLGLIIEKVSGKTYAEFMRESVFAPLGMKDTGFDDGKQIGNNVALGYSKRGPDIVAADVINMKAPFSAGALYSTAADMLRWSESLNSPKLLSQASLTAMFTPEKRNYAYGWAVASRNGRVVQNHTGGIDGFSSYIARYPNEKVTVIVLLNTGGANIGPIGNDISSIVFGEKYELPKARTEVVVDGKILDAYAGSYQVAPGLVFVIARTAAGLTFQPTGQPRAVEMFAESDTKFFLKVVDAQITFVKNADGKITGLEFQQAGRTTKAARLE